MRVKSLPTTPDAKAAAGVYAIQQNGEDRSNALLNDLVDRKLRPLHEAWLVRWHRQQERERAMPAVLGRSEAAQAALSLALRQALTAAWAAAQARGMAPELPDLHSDLAVQALGGQAAALEAVALRIVEADDTQVPAEERDTFRRCYLEARRALSEADEARAALMAAQGEREGLDGGWMQAYSEYHRAVEYVCKGDSGLIKCWILEDPAV